MPYPSKTDRETILSAAVKELVHGGIRDLSLRNIAASLDLAPNAIYRYFADRRALEAALANEAARQLELALRKAADGCEPVTAIRKMSSAYIKFARNNPHLYEAMMSFHAPGHDATSHLSLWAFTVEQVQRIAGADRAAKASVALWAFLHGADLLGSLMYSVCVRYVHYERHEAVTELSLQTIGVSLLAYRTEHAKAL